MDHVTVIIKSQGTRHRKKQCILLFIPYLYLRDSSLQKELLGLPRESRLWSDYDSFHMAVVRMGKSGLVAGRKWYLIVLYGLAKLELGSTFIA